MSDLNKQFDSAQDLSAKFDAAKDMSGEDKTAIDYFKDLGRKTMESLPTLGRETVNALPTIGGVVGGMLGTPADAVTGPAGTIVGAGIGGFIGASAKNAINSYIDPQQAPKDVASAIIDPALEGGKQALIQGTGLIAAPALERAASVVASPVAQFLSKFAKDKAAKAAGIPFAKALGLSPEIKQKLLDAGIVGAGDTQAAVAQKIANFLTKATKSKNEALQAIDSGGASGISKDEILNILSNKIKELKASSGTADAARELEHIYEDVAAGRNNFSLSQAEATKIQHDVSIPYGATPKELAGYKAQKAAADTYRSAVEDAASTQGTPELNEQFLQAKRDYGQIKTASDLASDVKDTSSSIDLEKAGKKLGAVAVGGMAGYKSGGIPGAVVGAGLGALGSAAANRAPATAAAGANALSKAISAAPEALRRLAPAAGQILGKDLGEDTPAVQSRDLSDQSPSELKNTSDQIKEQAPELHSQVAPLDRAIEEGNFGTINARLNGLMQMPQFRAALRNLKGEDNTSDDTEIT